MLPEPLLDQAAALAARLRERGLRVALAESCTGGLVAAALTHAAGASEIFECGLVVYSNAAKIALLGVPAALIAQHGAVSEPVARAMAEGALARSAADLAVSVTGIAGPGGGTAEKPVGLVWIGLAQRGGATLAARNLFSGDRSAVRRAAAEAALLLLGQYVNA